MGKPIKKIVVTYEDNTTQTFEGDTGFVHKHTISKKGQPYRQQVTASVTLPISIKLTPEKDASIDS